MIWWHYLSIHVFHFIHNKHMYIVIILCLKSSNIDIFKILSRNLLFTNLNQLYKLLHMKYWRGKYLSLIYRLLHCMYFNRVHWNIRIFVHSLLVRKWLNVRTFTDFLEVWCSGISSFDPYKNTRWKKKIDACQ